jgi:hypothetical protein
MVGKGDLKMNAKNEKAWKEFRAANSGGYESGILDFAERWAGRMEACFDDGKPNVLDQIAEATMDKDEEGLRLTNLQLAAVIAALVRFWTYGGMLELWRKEYWRAVRARRER